MKYLKYILLILILQSLSCKKKIVEIPPSNEPVFFVTGTFEQENISLIVGDNAQTNSEINLNNGIDFYKGVIFSNDLQFSAGIFRGNAEQNNVVFDSINAKEYIDFSSLINQNLTSIDKSFFENSAKIKEIKWYINETYSGINSLVITTPGHISLCAEVTFLDNSKYTICNDLIVGYRRENIFALDFSVVGGVLDAGINLSQGSVNSINWFLDDILVEDSKKLYMPINNQKHLLRADIIFSNGVKRTRTVLVDGSSNNYSLADFAQIENLCNIFWDYTMELSIIKGGVTYSTSMTDNSAFKFHLSSFELFSIDKNNKVTYKVEGTLEANVKSKNSNEIKHLNLKVSMPIVLN